LAANRQYSKLVDLAGTVVAQRSMGCPTLPGVVLLLEVKVRYKVNVLGGWKASAGMGACVNIRHDRARALLCDAFLLNQSCWLDSPVCPHRSFRLCTGVNKISALYTGALPGTCLLETAAFVVCREWESTDPEALVVASEASGQRQVTRSDGC
jgi:hypothetical protein